MPLLNLSVKVVLLYRFMLATLSPLIALLNELHCKKHSQIGQANGKLGTIATYYLSRTGPVQEIFKNYSKMWQKCGHMTLQGSCYPHTSSNTIYCTYIPFQSYFLQIIQAQDTKNMYTV